MNRPASQSGVMLLEVLIGILIFSIGILAMLGMQATAIRATVDAKYRTEASFLANEIIGQMWVDRTNLASYATPPTAWVTRVQTLLPNATGANAPTITIAGSQVTVTVRWQRPASDTVSNHTATANINGS
jgi:type IV pilus assembly protein PilV